MIGLSMGQAVRMCQRIEAMQRLELRQELKMVLKLVLAILEQLMLEQRIDMGQIHALKTQLAAFPHSELESLAHEAVRQGGLDRAESLRLAMKAAARLDREEAGDALWQFERSLDRVIEDEVARRDTSCHQWRGIRLVMQMILRDPHLFGGRDGSPQNLVDLLETVPQADRFGRVRWVLAGGWAVELHTGEHRPHHDIDTLMLTPTPLYLDTDEVHADDYFGILSCGARFVARNCISRMRWRAGDKTFEGVLVLCSEFLFLLKFLHAPRPQDWQDVELLVRRYAGTWDLTLMRKLIARKAESFGRTRELMSILGRRDPEQIVAALRDFHAKEA